MYIETIVSKDGKRAEQFAVLSASELDLPASVIAEASQKAGTLAAAPLAEAAIHKAARKAVEAGRAVVQVDPRNTTKLCSGCGCIVPKDLNARTHTCPDCGLVLDRDHNAAINILARGLAGIGQSVEAPAL